MAVVANPELQVAAIGPDDYPFDITTLRAILGALRPGSGPILPDDFTLSPADPAAGLAADIAPGRALLEGPNVGQGSYFVHSSQVKTLPWPFAPGSLDRIDTLIVVVRDSQYGAISGPLGPAWVPMDGVEDAAPVPLSDAAIQAQLSAGDVWLGAYDVYVAAGATVFSPGDFTRRYEPLTTARRGSELKVTTNTSGAFLSWAAGNDATWQDFLSAYWDPVVVRVPATGQIRVSITGRAGNGNTSDDNSTVRFRYRLSGANVVSGDSLTEWSFVSRGSKSSPESSTTSKTVTGLTPGWTTVTPQCYVSPNTTTSELGITGGDLDVQPIY